MKLPKNVFKIDHVGRLATYNPEQFFLGTTLSKKANVKNVSVNVLP